MEQLEPPECPVCLNPYDSVTAIPRVLTCGHTTCEACLKQLPNPFPNTIRCTVCSALIKFPNGPSSLPKNIDLLHFSSTPGEQNPSKDTKVNSTPSPSGTGKNKSLLLPLIPNSWSYEFYLKCKKWVLDKDSVFIDAIDFEYDGGVVCGRLVKSSECADSVQQENVHVVLFKIGEFVENEEKFGYFKCSYESRVVSVLYRINEKKRNELFYILNATLEVYNVAKVYGFWCNENDRCVYMVCEKFASPNLAQFFVKKTEDEVHSLSIDEIRGLVVLGMDICEALCSLHSQGLSIGCLGPSCFVFNEFGRVYIDLVEVLKMGMKVNMLVREDSKKVNVIPENNSSNENFFLVSPEMLLRSLDKEELELDGRNLRYEVSCASDVWSLACLLIWLIAGESFLEEIKAYSEIFVRPKCEENGSGYSSFYTSWTGKIESLLVNKLGDELVSHQVLCKCLTFEPKNRPLISELWKCLRELVIKPQFDIQASLKKRFPKKNTDHYIVLGELYQIFEETNGNPKDRKDSDDITDRDVVEGVSTGQVKCVELKGHIACVSGLAIGNGFLFSSSYDKLIHVWSLQEFSLVHSFKGHEHRVTALVFVDGEKPLCLSGDNEGVICIWEVKFPFPEEPIKRLYEEKDWRYSGIHAMAVSGTEFLYTGSGDKLVKAWSLQDYNLSCVMSGHKSVVSSVVISNGVLYSGSYDGTVRLWSLSDHSSLAVLGADTLGEISSILSLSAEEDLLIVGRENGSIKILHNDTILKSIQAHKGAIFSISKTGKWLFTGGWDKTICLQEISENVDGVEVIPLGSIDCNSTITAILYRHGKLFIGQADNIIKVYHGV